MTHIEEKTLDVILDDEQRGVYSSGDLVSGYISLKFKEATTVKSLKVMVKGYAQVSWMHKRSRCSEERKYLSLSTKLLGATGTQDRTLDSGTHQIPFELQLPQSTLVSSFSGKYGRVYYMVQAVLKRPFNDNQSISRELCIINHVNVNMPTLLIYLNIEAGHLIINEWENKSPVSQTCKKMIGRWIFASGPISLTVSIDRQGYCSGELIPIFAVIENRSSRLVMPKAVFYQIQTYNAKGKTKIMKQVVSSARGNAVPSNFSSRWNGNTLKIPPVSPSILNSDILKVEYVLSVTVEIPGAKNLEVQHPVVICTSGLSYDISRLSTVDMGLPCPTFSLPDEAEAPPSYAEVVSEQQRILTCQSEADWLLGGPAFGFIHQFPLQPPPSYSEIYPNEH